MCWTVYERLKQVRCGCVSAGARRRGYSGWGGPKEYWTPGTGELGVCSPRRDQGVASRAWGEVNGSAKRPAGTGEGSGRVRARPGPAGRSPLPASRLQAPGAWAGGRGSGAAGAEIRTQGRGGQQSLWHGSGGDSGPAMRATGKSGTLRVARGEPPPPLASARPGTGSAMEWRWPRG